MPVPPETSHLVQSWFVYDTFRITRTDGPFVVAQGGGEWKWRVGDLVPYWVLPHDVYQWGSNDAKVTIDT